MVTQSTSNPRRGRAEQRDATRATVLAAAIDLFAARGFDGASLPVIASESGTPVPLIVYHFGSKDGLWRAAVDEIYGRVHAHVATFAPAIAAASGIEWFRLSIKAHVSALSAHPQYMRILFQEGTQDSSRLTWLVDQHQSVLNAEYMQMIMRAQNEGLLPPMDPGYAKFVLSGALSLPFVLAPEYRLTTGEEPQTEDFIDRHVDTFIRLFLSP